MKTKLLKIKDIKASANEGFTLIELLVVIGILAILMGIVLIAINPAHQFAMANNTTRRNAVSQILSGVGQFEAENKGLLPTSLQGLAKQDPNNSPTATEISNTGADLCTDIVAKTPQYIPAFPNDPKNNGSDITGITSGVGAGTCGTYDAGYQVYVDLSNRVHVLAPNAEEGAKIEVVR